LGIRSIADAHRLVAMILSLPRRFRRRRKPQRDAWKLAVVNVALWPEAGAPDLARKVRNVPKPEVAIQRLIAKNRSLNV